MYKDVFELKKLITLKRAERGKLISTMHPALFYELRLRDLLDSSLDDEQRNLRDYYLVKNIEKEHIQEIHISANSIINDYVFSLRELGEPIGKTNDGYDIDDLSTITLDNQYRLFNLNYKVDDFITIISNAVRTYLFLTPFWMKNPYMLYGVDEKIILRPCDSPTLYLTAARECIKNNTAVLGNMSNIKRMMKAVEVINSHSIDPELITANSPRFVESLLYKSILVSANNVVMLKAILDHTNKSKDQFGSYDVVLDDNFNVVEIKENKTWQ